MELSRAQYAKIVRGEVAVNPDYARAIRLQLRKARTRAAQWSTPKPRRDRRRCGATTRKGAPCQRLPVPDRRRCRNHGGLSTGAKTPEGRERIAKSNRRRAKKSQPNKS